MLRAPQILKLAAQESLLNHPPAKGQTTPLGYAVASGRPKVVEILLKAQAPCADDVCA